MNKVILQPAGDKHATINYNKTIINSITLSDISKYLNPKDISQLKKIYPNGETKIWGVIPGKKNINVNKWKKIQSSDICLFSKKGGIFSSSVVTYKIRNKELALNLWNTNGEGFTWEYIFFVNKIKQQSIQYLNFNRTVGYKDSNFIQNFYVLDEEKSSALINKFNFRKNNGIPLIITSPKTPITKEPSTNEENVIQFNEAQYNKLINDLAKEGNLNNPTISTSRKEQGLLRKHIFGNKEFENCAICNQKYPVELLIAAHIQKRAECTTKECLDFQNIAMPACKMGCDDLFEKGFIYVNNGKIKINTEKEHLFTPPLIRYINRIEDNICGKYNKDTKEYFNWHKSKHKTEFMEFSVNDVVQHKTFGVGKIVGVEGLGANQKLSIDFQNKLSKELLNKYANLKLLVS